jgi:hypothetical protein
MRRSYILLNLSNYGCGFLVSLFLTFSYTGAASYIVFAKQTLSSMLCLLFVTIPFERAMVRNQDKFYITYSYAQVIISLVMVLASTFWMGRFTQEWTLTTSMLVFGSLAQLAIALLSVHWLASQKFARSVSSTIMARLIDFLPITLLEYDLITTWVVITYYFVIALSLLVIAMKSINLTHREQYFFSYEVIRLLTMLSEIVITNYLIMNSTQSKLIFFANSICLAFITLIMTPYWEKYIPTKVWLICASIFSVSIALISPIASLVLTRVVVFACGARHAGLLLAAPTVTAVIFLSQPRLVEPSILIAIAGYGLITGFGSYSLRLMKHAN